MRGRIGLISANNTGALRIIVQIHAKFRLVAEPASQRQNRKAGVNRPYPKAATLLR